MPAWDEQRMELQMPAWDEQRPRGKREVQLLDAREVQWTSWDEQMPKENREVQWTSSQKPAWDEQRPRERRVVPWTSWKIREFRRQTAKWKDKQVINSLRDVNHQLQEELRGWERWYYRERWSQIQAQEQWRGGGREQQMQQPQQQQQQRQQPIDYSKWDKMSFTSDDDEGDAEENQESHSSIEEDLSAEEDYDVEPEELDFSEDGRGWRLE